MVQSGGCMINATKVDEKWRLHSFSRALVKHEKASEEALLSFHVAYAACSLSLSLSLLRARARARFDLLQRGSFSLFSGARFRLLLPLRRLASPRLARTPSVRPSLRVSCIFIRAWVLPFFRFHALFLVPYLHELS